MLRFAWHAEWTEQSSWNFGLLAYSPEVGLVEAHGFADYLLEHFEVDGLGGFASRTGTAEDRRQHGGLLLGGAYAQPPIDRR